MSIIRSANAVWEGNLQQGKGSVSVESGLISNANYSFTKRFGDEAGTNPEELLAAAHAACFSMALSAGLSGANYKVNSVKTIDKVTLEKVDGGFKITTIDIHCEASVEGVSNEDFQKIALDTKAGCPISKALTGVSFVLHATLK
jgi:lipoyl-dependent peroxiredoxin